MESSELFDFVIVGGGMIGSSTAKHVANICSEKNINARIALIGVAEEGKICTHRTSINCQPVLFNPLFNNF